MIDQSKKRGRPPKAKPSIPFIPKLPIVAVDMGEPTDPPTKVINLATLAAYLDYWKKELPGITTLQLLRLY